MSANKENYKTGDVLKIYYFMTYGKHRRVFTFTGLCVNKNAKTKTFSLQNYYGKEFIWINFSQFSPNIISLEKVRTYNFKHRLNKLYYFKKISLSAYSQGITRIKNLSKKVEPLDYLYETQKVILRKKKHLRNKYRL